jgi:hypothetical protein
VANGTEVAHFPVIKGKDPALGFLNSWYDEGSMSLGMFDTTPNGPTGLFYDLWQAKDNGYVRIFAAWFEFEEHSKPFESTAAREAFVAEYDDDEREDELRRRLRVQEVVAQRAGVGHAKIQQPSWKTAIPGLFDPGERSREACRGAQSLRHRIGVGLSGELEEDCDGDIQSPVRLSGHQSRHQIRRRALAQVDGR